MNVALLICALRAVLEALLKAYPQAASLSRQNPHDA